MWKWDSFFYKNNNIHQNCAAVVKKSPQELHEVP